MKAQQTRHDINHKKQMAVGGVSIYLFWPSESGIYTEPILIAHLSVDGVSFFFIGQLVLI